jgi:hypothetical protein
MLSWTRCYTDMSQLGFKDCSPSDYPTSIVVDAGRVTDDSKDLHVLRFSLLWVKDIDNILAESMDLQNASPSTNLFQPSLTEGSFSGEGPSFEPAFLPVRSPTPSRRLSLMRTSMPDRHINTILHECKCDKKPLSAYKSNVGFSTS